MGTLGTPGRHFFTAASPALAQLLREQLVAAWQARFPTAVTCFEED